HDPQRFFCRLKAFIRLIVDPIGFGQKREPTWLVHPCSGCQKICDTVAQLNNSLPRSTLRSRGPARHNACLRLPKRKTVFERQCLHLIGQFFDDLRFSSALVDEKRINERLRRPSVKVPTLGRPTQGGSNSGRKVNSASTGSWRMRSMIRLSSSREVASAHCASSKKSRIGCWRARPSI